MADVTMDEIFEACQQIREKIRLMDPRVQFLEDREAARQEDIEKNRGYLVLNPELDLSGLEDPDVHGLIIERDGVEYRVIVDEKMRGMTDSKTGEMRQGWWLPPMTSLEGLAQRALIPPSHIPTAKTDVKVEPMKIPSFKVLGEVPKVVLTEGDILDMPSVRAATDEEYAPAAAAIARSIEEDVDKGLLDEILPANALEERALWKTVADDMLEQLRQGADRQFTDWMKEEMQNTVRQEAVIAVFKTYYDRVEAVDREYPHVPSTYTRNGVAPALDMPRWMKEKYHQKIRALIERRKQEFRALEPIDDADRKSAAREALHRHERELKPCECRRCWEYRQ